MFEGSVVRDHYPDPDARGGDLEHISVISVRAVLPTIKLRSCAGCSGRFVGRDLYEVMDWHESLVFFEGDRICEQCACNHGVL